MIKTCDRCGENYDITKITTINEEGIEEEISNFFLAFCFEDLNRERYFQDINLCPDCMEKVLDLLNPSGFNNISILGGKKQ